MKVTTLAKATRGRPLVWLILLLLCTASSCARQSRQIRELQSVDQDRPPDRNNLQRVGGLPMGHALQGGLPGSNARANQDSSGEPQNETTIVANPTDPLNLVGAWNDYFALDPGQNTVIGYGWTTDGGQTWQSDRIDFASLPADQSSGDPALAVDSTGIFYLGILAYGGTEDGILVARSLDGGANWQEPVRLDVGGDKEFVTVDPDNDSVYVVWENAGGQIRFSRSTDRGLTFTAYVQVSDGPASEGNGAYPAVGPDGEVYVVWTDFFSVLYFDRSFDGGVSWQFPDRTITTTVAPPGALAGGFRNFMLPAIAVDRSNGPQRGRIYVVWPDQRFGSADTLLIYSDDDGVNWSAPLRVNDDAQDNDADQFFPWVAVDDNGHVQVTFLDRRDDPNGLLFALYLATSTDGGQSFGPNVRISDGIYGPSAFGFLGDYTGAALSSDNRIHPMWPDARLGNEDIFTQSVDLADYDEDAVLNDGDADGQYANNRCTGGLVVDCDDNCPGTPNPGQFDDDGDMVGDACDNCPLEPNTDQADTDRDGKGNPCDPCPLNPGDPSDPDGDGHACVDNCPTVSNPGQEDLDGDGFGDACDACPTDPLNLDDDGDGQCNVTDNCIGTFNPQQVDADADGHGDPCDICTQVSDPLQSDTDLDGAGDACDCEPLDANDRSPGAVNGVVLYPSGNTTIIEWTAEPSADAYSITRGMIADLPAGSYGACLAEGLATPQSDDSGVPPPGQGFAYLIQGQSFDCGLGSLGFADESERINTSAGVCQGAAIIDDYPTGEIAVAGTVSGSYLDTVASDDGFESIEEEVTGGNPSQRYSFLEHRWSFTIAGGSAVELHVEGFRSNSLDGDDFLFQYSIDGNDPWIFTTIHLPVDQDGDSDLTAALPAGLSGSLFIRVVDTNQAPGASSSDTVSIDELFIRSIP